jgi:hypothetical protein
MEKANPNKVPFNLSLDEDPKRTVKIYYAAKVNKS